METTLSDIDLALARAVVHRFAAELFRHPDARWEREWEERCAGIRGALEMLDGGEQQELAVALADLCAAKPALEQVACEHARHFGHTPRAAATPYETEWSASAGNLLQFHQLADLAAFYKAFGLELARGCDERQDHLSVEISFLHFLCVKEAWAREQNQEDLAAVVLDGERRFLAEHLARWSTAFCARLARAATPGFYGCVARFTEAWIRAECARLGVEPGDAALDPGETTFVPEDACMSCSLSAGCLSRAAVPASSDGTDRVQH